MIRVHVRDLAWDWLKNYLELPYSELNVSLVSHRGDSTPHTCLSAVVIAKILAPIRAPRDRPGRWFRLITRQDPGSSKNSHQVFDISWPRNTHGIVPSTVTLVRRNGEVVFVEKGTRGCGPDSTPVRSTDRSGDGDLRPGSRWS